MTETTNVRALRGTGETNESYAEDGVELIGEQLKKDIRDSMDHVRRLRGDRKALNEDIASILSGLKAQGVPPEAIKRAFKDAELDVGPLAALDRYHALAREILGRPVQGEMELVVEEG